MAAAFSSQEAAQELPVSERTNGHTQDIDVSDLSSALRMLGAADSEIFGGWQGHPGLSDEVIQSRAACVAAAIARGISTHGKSFKCIMSGCGTSGRLAWRAAAQWNAVLQENSLPPVFDYLVSGGDAALLLSDELPEDDATTGIRELQKVLDGCPSFVFIGISCGLSAPYVAGQVHWAMEQPGTTTCMLGFNPASLARDAPVEGFSHSVRDVVLQLAASPAAVQHILLNPVIGPEPITGSTRMKGGSTTKVLLDTMLACAINATLDGSTVVGEACIQRHLLGFQSVCSQVAFQTAQVKPLVQVATDTLKRRGHLYYMGSATAGFMGMIDASEMPDTYGSPFDEVRGFVSGGWGDADVHTPAEQLTAASQYCKVEPSDFIALDSGLKAGAVLIVCTLGSATVDSQIAAAAQHAADCGATVALLNISNSATVQLEESKLLGVVSPDLVCSLKVCTAHPLCGGATGPHTPQYCDMALKWTLNAVTTLAQVGKGMVLSNKMVNVGVLNNKLFYRSLRLIGEFAQVSAEAAHTALLRSIYDMEDTEIPHSVHGAAISAHIKAATGKSNVVPRAMLLASGHASNLAHADQLLAQEPVLRVLLQQLNRPKHAWVTLSCSAEQLAAVVEAAGQVSLALQRCGLACLVSSEVLCDSPSVRISVSTDEGAASEAAARLQGEVASTAVLAGLPCSQQQGSEALCQCRPEQSAASGLVHYCVTGSTPDEAMYVRFRSWLLQGHVQELVQRAALSARVIDHGNLDGCRSVTSVYCFESVQHYQEYSQVHAPVLKAQSAALFQGTEATIAFSRSVFQVQKS